MAAGADVVGPATTTNVPQTPVMVSPSGQVGRPVDPNQVSTKPRQMPGGSGGGQGFDPAANGSDGGPGSPLSPDPDGDSDSDSGDDSDSDSGKPPTVASLARLKGVSKAVTAIMRTVRAENPGIPLGQAHAIAVRTLEAYPMIVQADWHGIDFGHRPGVPDGPITDRVKQGPEIPKQVTPGNSRGSEPAPSPEGPGGISVTPGMGKVLHFPTRGPGLPGGVSGEMAAASEVAADGAGLARLLPLLAL